MHVPAAKRGGRPYTPSSPVDVLRVAVPTNDLAHATLNVHYHLYEGAGGFVTSAAGVLVSA